jgi:hypothetical protein
MSKKAAQAGATASNPMVVVGEPGPELVTEEEEAPLQLDHPALRDTDNSRTTSYEEALLREYYGEPVDGVYGGCEE